MYGFLKALAKIVMKASLFMKVEGEDNLPDKGAVIVCSNHKSNWDVLSVAVAMKRDLSFIAKAELFKIPILNALLKKLDIVPLKRGAGDVSAVKAALTILKKGNVVTIFPEGTRVRKGRKVRSKPGAVRLAVMTGTPIVPVGISGNYRPFKRLSVRVGNPMDFSKYKGEKLSNDEIKQLTEKLMEEIYGLAKD